MFSTSDEYETALIMERRAQGRYDRRRSPWPIVMFVGCALMVAGSCFSCAEEPREPGMRRRQARLLNVP